ncbi:MAG: capsule assembly Wzi family protein [Bacteroidetes bacterium]|nr:capsule assembly Wzi family protein [Bacteroidota bacterium]
MNLRQYRKSLLGIGGWLIFVSAGAQQTYWMPGDAVNHTLRRIEILSGSTSGNPVFTKCWPSPRTAEWIKPIPNASAADRWNWEAIRAGQLSISEIPADSTSVIPVSRPRNWGPFFKRAANFYDVHVPDFDLIVNPVLGIGRSIEPGGESRLFQNTRGVVVDGRIAGKIGFHSYLTENQERLQLYAQQWERTRMALPNQGFYKSFKGSGYDFFDARGYITFPATKYVEVAFGYDRHFIGNGHRSLFLSDWGNSAMFLRLNTRIWKFNYRNLFLELDQADNRSSDRLLAKKYAAMHHLDLQVNRWLQLGLFEGVIFSRPNGIDLSYLNPIIFYRSIEHQHGSRDNAVAGLDWKIKPFKLAQFYGQFLLDEFYLSELRAGNQWWANKWGYQAGLHYMNVGGVQNLDLQLEYNRVRPFTYSHRDSITNYTHYNQPLAHPLGANFSEFIGIVRCQPLPRMRMEAKVVSYRQGRDSTARSFGSNIFLPYNPPFRVGDYGYAVGSGRDTRVLLANLFVSYEWIRNLFVEAQAGYRRERSLTKPLSDIRTKWYSLGLRWNWMRREIDY